eukprot:s3196_g2.t1
MLAAQAQRDWRSRAPINEWWPAAVDALRARAFIPVKELSAAVEHVALAFAPPVLHSSSVLRFRAWAAERPGHVTSLAELVRAIAVAPEGHYIAAPLQEALLTLLVGPAAVTTLARLIEGHRARPVDVPSLPPPPPPGMPRSPHALRPKMSKPSRALASEAGSGTPPVPATGTRSREPAIAARCEALGINMHAPSAPAPDTAFAVVRDYAMRTFSRGAHPRGMLQSPRRAGARLRGAARRPHALEPAASPRHYRHRSMATTMDVYALPQRAAVGTHLCPGPDPRMPPVLDAYALGGRPRETTQKVGLQPLPLCLYQTTRARGCPTM